MEVFVTTMAPRKGERKGHHQNKEEFRIKKLYINQMVYLVYDRIDIKPN